MKRFNIRQVEAFRAVVTLGSMTTAAEHLGISQPAVSRLMTDFQDAAGFRLFNRHRGGAEPTDDARRLFEQVEKLFVGLEELNQEVHAIRQLKSGAVSLVAMGPYDNGLLPDLIARFRASNPDIQFSITSQPQDRIPEWVNSGRADIGILSLPAVNSSADVRELMTRPAFCVFPAGHPLANKPEITAEDLAGQSFVSFPRGTPFRFRTDTLFERAGIERHMITEATTHEAVCNLIAAGLGVGIVSPFSPHLKRNPALVFRPFTPSMPITLGVIAQEAQLSVAAQAFHDFLTENVARMAQEPALANER